MLGKRARQIQRTTSMSHLGPRSMFTERGSLGDSSVQPRNPNSAAGGLKISRPLDDGNQLQIVGMVEDEVALGMNFDQVACHGDGLLLAQESSTSDHSEECYTSLVRSMETSSFLSPQASSWAHHIVSVPMQARQQDVESILPAEFLKVCFRCNRRLGHGQDTYMYRGDVAFCSEDCRSYQISKDERKGKCSVAASKKGNATPAVNIESEGKVVSSETAVGA